MLILPVLLVVAVGWIAWSLLHHRHPVAATAAGPTEDVHHRQVMPMTLLGWVGFATGLLVLASVALVNVVQLPFLSVGLLLAAAASTLLARFVQHDRSTVVLLILAASVLALLGGLLFLGGEVLIGHD
jgi:hypothetical protein